MIKEGKANVIIGGQWGSEGKGKLAGWLYHNHPEIDVAVSDFTPNTGHTYVAANGKAFVSKILPIGAAFRTVKLVIIGPHAVIDVDRFLKEHRDFECKTTIAIHPLTSVLQPGDVKDEVGALSHIASTMQGSASAQLLKVMRNPERCSFAKDHPLLSHMVADTHALIQDRLSKGSTVLIETGQGFDLGLNHGHEWPYVTGRDCMVGRSLDSAGVSPKQIGSIIAALRTYPIRVGNTPDGHSGPCHSDQREISWQELSEKIGRQVREITTVTKRVRRVFTWSNEQVERMCMTIQPDFAFLNFVNYLTEGEVDTVLEDIVTLLNNRDCYCCLALLGTGAGLDDMEHLI